MTTDLYSAEVAKRIGDQ